MAIRPSLLSELKRRNVLRAAVLYVGTVWLLAQVITQVGPVYDAPAWIARWFLAASAVGFPFWIALAWFYELTPDGLKRESEVVPGESIRQSTGRKLDRAIIAVLAVAVVLLLTNTFMWHQGKPAAGGAARAIPEKSVAVLPLVNAGGAQGQQYFSDGLSEALIIALSQFDGLKVIGRNSSFQFRDTKDDSAAIGRKLGVAHLLEGSVQHAGDAVRISIELIDAASGQTRWSQRYDRPYKDLFALQDDITRAVAGALHAKLLLPSEVARQDDRPPSGNIEAYNAYLRGLKQWHDEHFFKAAEYMGQAVQLDPGYAVAWAHLSGALSTVAAFSDDAPAVASKHMREARTAADKALQLASGLGPAHAARAYLAVYSFDHQGALVECRRAVQLALDDATVLNGCGFVLAQIGKLEEAIRLREHLLSIEPLYTVNYFEYVRLMAATGRLDEAAKYLRIAEGLSQPGTTVSYQPIYVAIARGDAVTALEAAKQVPAAYRDAYAMLAAQVGPDRAVADAALAKILAGGDWGKDWLNTRAYLIAQAYALRNDPDSAMKWLERASTPDLLFLLTDPLILRFRDDPRLIAFNRKVGLPPPGESDALSIDQIRAIDAKKN